MYPTINYRQRGNILASQQLQVLRVADDVQDNESVSDVE